MVTLSGLNIYPIKSCGGISLEQAEIGALGLALDRRWMLVDWRGNFLSQREYPLMATIVPTLLDGMLLVRAPGMSPLTLPLQQEEHSAAGRMAVTIWDDHLDALDCGEDMHRWFSSYLGIDARLVRFDPAVRRLSSARWTGAVQAPTQFSDGFPLLVANEASLADLNQRMQAKGAPKLPMERFRPNLVLAGLDAYEEDYIDTLTLGGAGSSPHAQVILRLVKPCARCPVPGVDQRTGLRDAQWPDEPLDTLRQYRTDDLVGGAMSFGQNAIILDGVGSSVQRGQAVEVKLNF